MQKLALIPARKGSKRVPNKNIKSFGGIPIMGYSIKAALDWKFDEVIVYTDSYQYSRIAKEFGATCPFSREKADDVQGLYEVVTEVLLKYKLEMAKEWDAVCVIYPCAPFITHELIETGYNLMHTGNYDAVFPVVRNSFHYQQLMYFQGESIRHVFPAFRNESSNNWGDTYRHAGQFFWEKVPALKRNKTLIPDNSGALKINPWMGIDIDTPDDWEFAEVKYRVLKEMEYR